MGGVGRNLISARFFVTIGHFIALLLCFQIIENNVNKSLGDKASSTEKDDALRSSQAALAFGMACFLLDFGGMFFGTSLFYHTMNLLQIGVHFIGSVLLCWLITEAWSYKALWPLVVFTNLPTALAEAAVLVGVYGLRNIVQ